MHIKWVVRYKSHQFTIMLQLEYSQRKVLCILHQSRSFQTHRWLVSSPNQLLYFIIRYIMRENQEASMIIQKFLINTMCKDMVSNGYMVRIHWHRLTGWRCTHYKYNDFQSLHTRHPRVKHMVELQYWILLLQHVPSNIKKDTMSHWSQAQWVIIKSNFPPEIITVHTDMIAVLAHDNFTTFEAFPCVKICTSNNGYWERDLI